jgi:N utilization substance protein A
MKGMSVQSIIRELRGEKIDIIPYSEETVAFAQKALSPAKVTRVQIVDPESRKLEVIVEDSQLSLAIGKKGQNVRLASKLIGWDIDIKSEEEKRREIEEQMTALTAPTTPLTALAGVGPKTIEKVEAAGITNVEQLAGMTPEQLMEIPGIGEKMVDKIYQAVNRFYEGGGEAAAAAGEGVENTDELAEGAEASASPDEAIAEVAGDGGNAENESAQGESGENSAVDGDSGEASESTETAASSETADDRAGNVSATPADENSSEAAAETVAEKPAEQTDHTEHQEP